MTTTDVREWLREHPEVTGGETIGDRGNLRKAWRTAYDAAHPAEAPADDYGGGVTEADFPEPPADTGETPPRRPAKPKAAAPGRGLTRLFSRPQTGAKKRKPRVKLDSFAEGLWSDLAMVAPWPPLQICLGMQAAYASATFDDVIAGTFIDPLIQPLARADQAWRAVDGLLGPPLFCTLICMSGEREELPDGQPGDFTPRTKMLFAGLKYSLMQMSRIGDLNVERIEAAAASMAERAAAADALIAVMFKDMMPAPAQPPSAPPEDTVQAHTPNGGRRGPGFIYPAPGPMDETGADPGRA